MEAIQVMQVTDSLLPGGLERMAVNMANALPRDRFGSHLCVTRSDGPLSALILPDVRTLKLERRALLDLGAVRRMVRYIRRNGIGLLHAHGTSIFISVAASWFKPFPRVIWHDHFGRHATETRPVWLYRAAARSLSGVLAVSQPLTRWARECLGMPSDRVWYLPNFAAEAAAHRAVGGLPGTQDRRIVCVANLRPEKGHPQLLQAMRLVLRAVPDAQLLLVGRADDAPYREALERQLRDDSLRGHVTWLGGRDDVGAILKSCAMGVLSSVSEGLPLALIEYGQSGLASVATAVGQCPEVMAEGEAGLLVPPGSPEPLAKAMVYLLQFPEERERLGRALRQRVRETYSLERVIPKVCEVYTKVLA
jgi:glycosyltransferase involved in cell wall biosynthesis